MSIRELSFPLSNAPHSLCLSLTRTRQIIYPTHTQTHTQVKLVLFSFYDAYVLLTHALSSSLAGSFIVPSPLPVGKGHPQAFVASQGDKSQA